MGSISLKFPARAANNDLTDTLVFAANAKAMNHLYLNTLLAGSDTLNAEDWEQVEILANSCPYLAGNAVFRARVLYGMKHWGAHYDDLLICNAAGVYKNGQSPLDALLTQLGNAYQHRATKKTGGIKVYPNPADAFIAIDLDHCYTANSTFKLFDLLGREVLQTTLSAGSTYTRIDIHSIPEGIYLYQIISEGNNMQTGKLIIE